MNRGKLGALERVFAGELARSTVTYTAGDPAETGVLTPTGAWLRRIFMVGVLTEVTRQGEEIRGARLSDPTGAVELALRPRNLPPADVLFKVEPPAFLACSGSVRRRGERVMIEPDMLAPVQRAERDTWVLFTAERTIRRMEALEEARRGGTTEDVTAAAIAGYPPSELPEIASLVRVALETVSPPETSRIDADAVVREILTANPGVLEIVWVMERAKEQGIDEESARRVVRQLLAEGECYAPRNGHIRFL